MEKPSKPSLGSRIRKHFRTRFLTGILVIVPVSITVLVFLFLFRKVDGILSPLFTELIGFPIPGLGFVATILVLYLIGLSAASLFGKGFLNFLDGVFESIPIIRNVYQPARQFTQTLSLLDRSNFKRVVIVEYPRPGLKALAFVTGTSCAEGTGEDLLTVFIPTTPNPTTGMLEIVPARQVMETNLTVEEGIKLVASAGILSPREIEGVKR